MQFRDKTVFVIGAGAHADYHMPTARGLTDAIIDDKWYELRDSHGFGEMASLGGWASEAYGKSFTKEYNEFRDHLADSGANSIDQYVESVPKFARIGAFLIAAYLHLWEHNVLRREPFGGLYQKIFQRAWPKGGFSAEPAAPNYGNLTIVTFNYDRVMEFVLHHMAARNCIPGFELHELNGGAHPSAFHVYGSLTGKTETIDRRKRLVPRLNANDVVESAKKILLSRERDPETSVERGAFLARIEEEISGAANVVFLGFAFDYTNMSMLGFKSGRGDSWWTRKRKNFFASSVGLSENAKTDACGMVGQQIDFHDGFVCECLDRWQLT